MEFVRYQGYTGYIVRIPPESELPDFWHNEENVSCFLTEVMEEIGVNEEMVTRRRKTWLLMEKFCTLTRILLESNSEVYFFGSQTEGSTTLELASDTDYLLLNERDFNIIQNLNDWQPDVVSLLMITDENTSPGHCLLQVLRPDVPLPAVNPISTLDFEYQHRYTGDKIVLKNDAIGKYMGTDTIRSGPSFVNKVEGCRGLDNVHAFPFRNIPQSVTCWLKQMKRQGRLTDDMVSYIKNKGCFVVATGKKGSVNEELEWRISTSHAERCAVFSLNITQIQCYVLMKIIAKTYLKFSHHEKVSSFMCKNVLLRMVAKTQVTDWNNRTLLKRLRYCLLDLKDCITRVNCPHFIESENNLMQGKFSSDVRKWLIGSIGNLIQSKNLGLIDVHIDMLGSRLTRKFTKFDIMFPFACRATSGSIALYIAGDLVHNFASQLIVHHLTLALFSNNLFRALETLDSIYQEGNEEERRACCFLKPLIASSLGCELASTAIQDHSPLLPQVLELLEIGANSDVASGRLKQASVFYSVGNIQMAELILRETAEKYDETVVAAMCGFPNYTTVSKMFKMYSYVMSEGAIKYVAAFGLTLQKNEINCLPKELRYEMFRCIPEDPSDWFSMEIVDSLPYLYFLQYKIYGQLQRREDQQRALINLEDSIDLKPSIGHKETALNLLGQCLEKENRPDDALFCYVKSLRIRPTNNAANWHVLIKIYKEFYKRNAKKNTS